MAMRFSLDYPKGPEATELRLKRRRVASGTAPSRGALLGSLSLTYGRSGNRCHCVEGEGHPRWQFAYMVDGKKRGGAQRMRRGNPASIRGRARAFKESLTEFFAANAKLVGVGAEAAWEEA